MKEKFFVQRKNKYWVGLKHYEGISKVNYNLLYDIVKNSPYDKYITEEYLEQQIEKLKNDGKIKYSVKTKQIIKA